MEMARNPAAMREFMRSQDRQLSNIEVRGQREGCIIMLGCDVCVESAGWV